MARVAVAFAGLLLTASLLPLTQAGDAQLAPYIVGTPDAAAVEALGARVLTTYGPFLLAEATPAVAEALGQAWDVEALPTEIVKGAVRFDPRAGDVALPPELRATADDGYQVVQLLGPVKAEWRAALLERGAIVDYLPHHAFVLRAPASAVDALGALPFVTFVAPYHAAYKVAPETPTAGTHTFDVAVWGGEPVEPVVERIQALGGAIDVTSVRAFESYIRFTLDAAKVRDLARMGAVSWIEPRFPQENPLDNAQAAWVVQTGASNDRKLHNAGLNGRGQILADADTGLDTDSSSNPTRFAHDAFHDPNVPFVFGGAFNGAHRKVVSYHRLTEGGVVKGTFDDENGHGTHTAGSIVSDLAPFNSYNSNDGQSFGGRMAFIDWSSLPVDYFNMFDPTYQNGARLHSNSYGNPHNNGYTLPARQNDEYTYSHPDFLIFRSMGNTAQNTIRPEAVAKNVVSSGATQNGQGFENMAGFSSRGPTQDGRVKPTVVAPGEGVTSTCLSNTYCSLSGTSMSTPTTAGAAGLVRQYFQEGWYPGGAVGSGPGFNPSSALVRGVLINSGVPIDGAGTARPGLAGGPVDLVGLNCIANAVCPSRMLGANWPNGDMGWGVVRLDNTLKLAGDARGLFVADGATVGTGGTVEYQVTVANPAQGLKVTLAWADAPAAAGANPALVNNLDLVVVLPTGVEVKGNVFLGSNLGVSHRLIDQTLGPDGVTLPLPTTSVPGGSHDRRNVEEQVWFPSPAAGTYTIKVRGQNVPSGSQAFAVIAAGGI